LPEPPNILQQYLAARYDYDTCDEPFKSQARVKFEAIVEQIIRGSYVSRLQLVEALSERYRVYQRGRKADERRRQR